MHEDKQINMLCSVIFSCLLYVQVPMYVFLLVKYFVEIFAYLRLKRVNKRNEKKAVDATVHLATYYMHTYKKVFFLKVLK